jgi:hypothetical protein
MDAACGRAVVECNGSTPPGSSTAATNKEVVVAECHPFRALPLVAFGGAAVAVAAAADLLRLALWRARIVARGMADDTDRVRWRGII